MMSRVMRIQIYTVVGCMLNKIRAWVVVKLWTIWYYITNPIMTYKRINGRMERKMLYIYQLRWLMIPVLLGLSWWASVYYIGFFKTILYNIIGIAMYMLWFNLNDVRR